MRVLFDSNVIIDAISQRDGFNEDSKACYLAVPMKRVAGFLCAKQITDIHYTLQKYLKNEAINRKFISFLLSNYEIIPTSKEELSDALDSDLDDYEDAVLLNSSLRCGLDAIVTNNQKDFKNAKIRILSPKELLELI